MKNMIGLMTLALLVSNTPSIAQNSWKEERKQRKSDWDAEKEVVSISRQEWKAAQEQYSKDMYQYHQVMTEQQFLNYKTTLFDGSIKAAEARLVQYQAGLTDPNPSVQKISREKTDSINAEIASLKAQKADAEKVAKDFEVASKGTYKTPEQIDAEIAAVQKTIEDRIAPFDSREENQGDPMSHVFLRQDLKYQTFRSTVKTNAPYASKNYLNKKYPPESMFKSEVTDFYASKSAKSPTGFNSSNDQGAQISRTAKNGSTGTHSEDVYLSTKGKTGNTQNKKLFSMDVKDQKPQDTNTTMTATSPTTASAPTASGVKTDTNVPATTSTAPVTNSAPPTTSVPATNTASTGDAGPWVNGSAPKPYDFGAGNDTKPSAQTAAPGSKTVQSCEDEAMKAIYKALNSDKNNAFAKLYELTVLRVAKKALEQGNVTLEGYTKKKITDLEGYFNKVKEAGEVQTKVQQAYELYGKPSDLESINKDLDAALAKGKKACYWASNTRLYNDQAAAYVLAVSASEKDSGLSDADAAMIWAVEKIRTKAGYQNGTANGNLMSVSTRVARYLGAVQSRKALSKEEFDQAISTQEKELNELVAKAYAGVKESLHACINSIDVTKPCTAEYDKTFSDKYLGLSAIQRGLASEVRKAENQKMTGALKGKIGEMEFDFTNFAKGSVQPDPSRMSKEDACGNPVQKKAPEKKTESNVGVHGLPKGSPLEVALSGKPFDHPAANLVSVPGTPYFVTGGDPGNMSAGMKKIVLLPMKECVSPLYECPPDTRKTPVERSGACCDPSHFNQIVYKVYKGK